LSCSRTREKITKQTLPHPFIENVRKHFTIIVEEEEDKDEEKSCLANCEVNSFSVCTF